MFCYKETPEKNFVILSPQLRELSVRALQLHDQLQKSTLELLPTLVQLHRDADSLFREVMVLRFEIALVRHKEISTRNNRVLKVERAEIDPTSRFPLEIFKDLPE